MEPRRIPSRRAGLVALAALLVFGASACSGGTGLVGTPPAATVNGTTITSAQVEDAVTGSKAALEAQIKNLRSQYANDPATLQQIEAEIPGYREQFQRGEHTYSTAAAAGALTDMINSHLYEQAVTQLGGTITEQDRSAAKQQLEQDVSYQAANKALRASLRRSTAAQTALQRRVPAELTAAVAGASDAYEAQLQQIYEQQKDSLEPDICFYDLGAADEAGAQALGDRVRAGEDAAAVAAEAAGGAAAQTQCLPPSQIAQYFGQDASTDVGAILGPVQTGGGYSVVVIDSNEAPTFESVRADIAAAVPDQFTQQAQDDINAWLVDVIGDFADVHVDPRFGTWDPETLRVVAPEAPPTTTTTSATASSPEPVAVAGS